MERKQQWDRVIRTQGPLALREQEGWNLERAIQVSHGLMSASRSDVSSDCLKVVADTYPEWTPGRIIETLLTISVTFQCMTVEERESWLHKHSCFQVALLGMGGEGCFLQNRLPQFWSSLESDVQSPARFEGALSLIRVYGVLHALECEANRYEDNLRSIIGRRSADFEPALVQARLSCSLGVLWSSVEHQLTDDDAVLCERAASYRSSILILAGVGPMDPMYLEDEAVLGLRDCQSLHFRGINRRFLRTERFLVCAPVEMMLLAGVELAVRYRLLVRLRHRVLYGAMS